MTTATPEQVSAILRDDDQPLYPAQIGVDCDGCRTATVRDYVVSAEQTKPERLEIARTHLRADGWVCDESGDFCPNCQTHTYLRSRLHTGSSTDCPACAAHCRTPETHNWGCACPPHGPAAARQVAEFAAAGGTHAHLSVDGNIVCLSELNPCPNGQLDITPVTRSPKPSPKTAKAPAATPASKPAKRRTTRARGRTR